MRQRSLPAVAAQSCSCERDDFQRAAHYRRGCRSGGGRDTDAAPPSAAYNPTVCPHRLLFAALALAAAHASYAGDCDGFVGKGFFVMDEGLP